jgi:hypothetical protein
MRNRFASMLCALALLACVPLSLGAQITSRTSSVSAGLVLTNVDKAFNVNSFSENADKSLTVIDLASLSALNLGYAGKLGDLYLGGIYSGNALGLTDSKTKSYSTTELVDSSNTLLGTRQTLTDTPTSSTGSDNKLSLMVGFGKIGILASVRENIALTTKLYDYSFNPSTNINSTTWDLASGGSPTAGADSTTPAATGSSTSVVKHTAVTSGTSSWIPAVQVGTSIELGDMIIKPYFSVSANLYGNTTGASKTSYTQNTGSGFATYNSITEVSAYTNYTYATNAGYTEIAANLGSSFTNGPWNFALYYGITPRIFSASYKDTDGSTSKTVAGNSYSLSYVDYIADLSTSTTTTVNGYQADPQSYLKHSVSGYTTYTAAPSDKMTFAFGFIPSFSLTSTSNSSSGSQVTTVVSTDSVTPTNGSTTVYTKSYTGNSVSTSSIAFSPTIAAAMQYKINNDCRFNMGASANLANVASSTTTTTVPGYSSIKKVTTNYDGTVSTNTYSSTIGSARSESRVTSFTLSNLSASIGWGFLWDLAEGVTLDTKFSTSGASFQTSSFTVLVSIAK